MAKGVIATDRRGFLKKAGQLALSHKLLSILVPAGALGAGYAEYETRDLTLHRLELSLPDWPRELDGYKLVQLSDIHLETLQIPLSKIVTMANAQDPDLLVITGDIATTRSDLNRVSDALRPLKAKDGKIAVMGNNDYEHFSHTQFEVYIKHIQNQGFQVLLNDARKIKVGNNAFWVVGVDDPATAHDDVDLAFAKVRNDGFPRLVLAHSTDCIDGLYDRQVDLLLTGHTHGGQIKLPLMRPILTNTLLGEEGIYAGYHVVNGIRLYINVGIGTSIVPLRVGVKPEVALFTLKRAMPV